MKRLSMMRKSGLYRVIKLNTDDIELELFLTRIGLYPNEVIYLERTNFYGCIMKIKNVKWHLDKDLARCVLVSELKGR